MIIISVICLATLTFRRDSSLGGYIAGPASIIDLIRCSARSFRDSNTMTPVQADMLIKIMDLFETDSTDRFKCLEYGRMFRQKMIKNGFVVPVSHDHYKIAN